MKHVRQIRGLLGMTLLVLASAYAIADDDEHEGKHAGKPRTQAGMLAKAPAVWKTECGSCHLAFPPGMLPPAGWKQQMATLDKHYGSNATLDAADAKAIRDFLLLASAGNGEPVPASRPGEPPRITSTAWFRHEHDEIAVTVWRRKSVGSAANCIACHGGAEKGDFDEDRVRIPR